jgi:exonuclease III
MISNMQTPFANLRLVTFNCNGFNSAESVVKKLCADNDICALQETWLFKHDLPISLSRDGCVHSFSISSINSEEGILRGRPYGGLTFLWSERVSPYVKIEQYNDDRMLGLSLRIEGMSILFINVYFPYAAHHNEELVLAYNGKLEGILRGSNHDHVCVMGDFNCHPGSRTFSEWQILLADNELDFVDIALLPQDTHTHVNHNGRSVKWLDHFALTPTIANNVTRVYVGEYTPLSDHLPLHAELSLRALPVMAGVDTSTQSINWQFNDKIKTEMFCSILINKLRSLQPQLIQTQAAVDRDKLDDLYGCICNAVLVSGRDAFGIKTPRGIHRVPGWTRHVAVLHDASVAAYVRWRNAGKPRNGPLHRENNRTNNACKYALRFCKKHEDKLRATSLSEKMINKRMIDFWKEMKNLKPKDNSVSQCVNGITGEGNIAEMWRNHFNGIMNSVNNDADSDTVNDAINRENNNDDEVNMWELRSAVKRLKN